MSARTTTATLAATILLVDDDEDGRYLLASVLRKRGFTVEAVESGDSCLAFLSATQSAIVVTDVQMPGMSGIELCRTLKGRYPSVIAIVLSGLTTPDTVAAALQLGAFAFLPKPVRAEALETAILDAAARAQP